MEKLVCIELGQTNTDGTTPCKTWVAQPSGVLDSLAITQSQAQEIGGSIFGFLLVMIIGSMALGGVKTL